MNKLLILFLLFSSFIFSQKKDETNSSLFKNDNYFHELQKEKFFLHTNKTTYFSGEKIWWKAYVVSDFSNKPITKTANLYVNFYDVNKKLISHQLFYCKNGKANGEIKLPVSLQTGNYYINIDTQWNKNFNNNYVVPINIINAKAKKIFKEKTKIVLKDAINLTFYPESEILLNNIINTVCVTLQNNDSFLANQIITIKDLTTNETIFSLRTNQLGYGKFKLRTQINHDYVAIVKYKNKIYKKKIPKALNSGVVIHKKESLNSNYKQEFVVKFSNDLLAQYHGQTFFTTIHRNHNLLYVLPFKVNKKYRNYVLPIAFQNLFNGAATITLFNNKNQVVSERNFYIETKKPFEIEVISKEITKDSIAIDLQIKDNYESTNLSISVLPEDTKLNTNASNVFAAFSLDPYIKDNIQSAKVLADIDLDMLLQTQAKQIKTHKFKMTPPVYLLEKGLSINGIVNATIKKGYKVLLISKENEILEVSEIKENSSFAFNNLVLTSRSNYKLALLNEKGKFVKAGFYIYKENKSYKPESILSYTKKQLLTTQTKVIDSKISNYIAYKDAEILDEVVIKSRKRKEDLIEENYPNNPKELGNGFTKKIQFNEFDELNNTVLQYLNNQPGIKASGNLIGGSVIFTRGALDSFTDDQKALIIFNGTPTTADVLGGIRLSEVGSIKINVSGAGYGMRGANGVVFINLKTGYENYKPTPNLNYYKSTTDFGFTASKPIFEASQLFFNSFKSRGFYETLDWIPNFNISPNKTATLKIYRGTHKNIKLFVNGMNNNGELIYKVIDISIKKGL